MTYQEIEKDIQQQVDTCITDREQQLREWTRRRAIVSGLIPLLAVLGVASLLLGSGAISRVLTPCMMLLAVIINIRTYSHINEILRGLHLQVKALKSIKRIDEETTKLQKELSERYGNV